MDQYSDFMASIKQEIQRRQVDSEQCSSLEELDAVKLEQEAEHPETMEEEIQESSMRLRNMNQRMINYTKKSAGIGFVSDHIKREDGENGNTEVKLEAAFTFHPETIQDNSRVIVNSNRQLNWRSQGNRKQTKAHQVRIQPDGNQKQKKIKVEEFNLPPQLPMLKKKNIFPPNSPKIKYEQQENKGAPPPMRLIRQQRLNHHAEKSIKQEEISVEASQKKMRIQPNWEIFRCICGLQTSGSYNLFNHIRQKHTNQSLQQLIFMAETTRLNSIIHRLDKVQSNRLLIHQAHENARILKQGQQRQSQQYPQAIRQVNNSNKGNHINQESQRKKGTKGNKSTKGNREKIAK